MSASGTSASARRDGLSYDRIDDVIADIHHLRDAGYRQAGQWTLEQIAWHLDASTRGRMRAGPFAPDTDETKERAKAFQAILQSKQLPAGIVAPPELIPPKDADASSITRLIETLERVKTHSHFAPHRLFGLMSDEDSRSQILIHCAHHLRNLTPNASQTPRTLRFESIDTIIEDAERLLRGHRAVGAWTLPEAAWHLGLAIEQYLRPLADRAESTAEQAESKKQLLDPLLSGGVMPAKLPIAPGIDPKTDGVGKIQDDAPRRFIKALRDLRDTPLKRVEFGIFGIVTIDEFRRFIEIHSANHLRHFVPAK